MQPVIKGNPGKRMQSVRDMENRAGLARITCGWKKPELNFDWLLPERAACRVETVDPIGAGGTPSQARTKSPSADAPLLNSTIVLLRSCLQATAR